MTPNQTSKDESYWQKRCEAAETLLKKHYKNIPDSAEYMNWQSTIEPPPTPIKESIEGTSRTQPLGDNTVTNWNDVE